MVKIAVLGAGINGVTCALRIKERYQDADVVLISEQFSPNTTGDGSGGLWYPFYVGNTSEDRITKWGVETYKFLHKLWLEDGLNISVMPVYVLNREVPAALAHRPLWADEVFGYNNIDERLLEYLNRLYNNNYVSGHIFTTFVVQPPKIISYLLDRFITVGGRVDQVKIKSLRDSLLDGYQVVVNCTGLGAKEIVPDGRVFPIRGQIFKVTAPWINMTVIDDTSGHYIIPNAETCVLGGTHQEDDFNTKLDEKDTDFILNGCRSTIPSMTNAKIVKAWVGLRPGRDEVRIESEERDGKLYIHNYGHGEETFGHRSIKDGFSVSSEKF